MSWTSWRPVQLLVALANVVVGVGGLAAPLVHSPQGLVLLDGPSVPHQHTQEPKGDAHGVHHQGHDGRGHQRLLHTPHLLIDKQHSTTLASFSRAQHNVQLQPRGANSMQGYASTGTRPDLSGQQSNASAPRSTEWRGRRRGCTRHSHCGCSQTPTAQTLSLTGTGSTGQRWSARQRSPLLPSGGHVPEDCNGQGRSAHEISQSVAPSTIPADVHLGPLTAADEQRWAPRASRNLVLHAATDPVDSSGSPPLCDSACRTPFETMGSCMKPTHPGHLPARPVCRRGRLGQQ
jgi:hypothetical protein